MGKKRIVLDTNVLISALRWGGNPRRIFDKVIDRDLLLCVSKQTLSELERVMDYPKFEFTAQERAEFLSVLTEIAILVEPQERIQLIVEDATDNMFLECAVEAGADFLISGDKHLLSLKEYQNVKLISPADFLSGLTQPTT